MLGGVCSGIGYYFSVQPVWVRIAFLVLFFGLLWFPAFPIGMLFIYGALWVSLPSARLEAAKGVRVLFRSKKNKAIGGVCAGLATYLGIDIAVVRLLFLIEQRQTKLSCIRACFGNFLMQQTGHVVRIGIAPRRARGSDQEGFLQLSFVLVAHDNAFRTKLVHLRFHGQRNNPSFSTKFTFSHLKPGCLVT
jgi:phage shock protein PspC (stress-responsive transcriptional regulator)